MKKIGLSYPDIFIFLTFFFGIFFFFLHPVTGDGDFFHHLSAGRYIVQYKEIPRVDENTFTRLGQKWIANAWGTGLLYYSIYTNFGPSAISIFIAFEAVLLFFLLYLLLRTYHLSNKIIFLSLALVAVVISTRWPNRPELVTYPAVVLILLIDRLRLRSPRLVLFYPLIIFTWSVLYIGSVFIGLLLLGLLIFKQFKDDKFTIKRGYWLLYIGILMSFPISLLNGNGLKGIFYIFLIPSIAKIQGEWAGIFTVLKNSPENQLLALQYHILLYFIFLVMFALLFFLQFKKIKQYFVLLVLSCSLLLPFFAIRNIQIAVVLSTPLFTVLLNETLKTSFKKIFPIIFLILIFSTFLAFRVNQHGVGEESKQFSPKLIAFFKDNGLTGNVLASQQTGSFLEYHLFPKVLVFSDTRDDLFLGSQVLSDFENNIKINGNALPLLSNYKVDIVVADIADRNGYEPLIYSPEWRLVYVEDYHLVFVRKNIALEKNLLSYNAIDPYSAVPTKVGMEVEAGKEYVNILKKDPNSFNIQFDLALIYFNQKKYDLVISTANNLKFHNSSIAALYKSKKDFLLSMSYLLTQQCGLAKQYLDAYHKDVNLKFIFDPGRKILGNDEEGYMIYYLTCQKDVGKAQQHLNNFLNEPNGNEAEKSNAKRIFDGLTGVSLN
jgi:hypothetical protein